MDKSAIGLIDSGVGGFTVLKELQNGLPKENFLYLGDSENMPYGEKENEEIVELVNADIAFLENLGVKFIILACNTASSLIDKLTSTVPLFSIVEAGCLAVLDYQKKGPVGLIATRATVKNGAYEEVMERLSPDIFFVSYGTPTLAKVINDQIDELRLLRRNIYEAITPILEQAEIRNLLLGCTHYPIVSETIQEMYPSLTLINPARKEIEIIERFLKENALENISDSKRIMDIYITGGETERERSKKLLDELDIQYTNLNIIHSGKK